MHTYSYTEDELLTALRNHDEQATRYVYQTNWPMILKMVTLNSGTVEDAKDIYQESMMDFLEKAWDSTFVLTCKISTFLYSICRRKWLLHLRDKPRFTDIEEYILLEEDTINPIQDETETLPDDTQIQKAIDSLGEPCRSLLIGFYFKKLSMEELAETLQYKSLQVAKQQKFRCKNRLKSIFGQ